MLPSAISRAFVRRVGSLLNEGFHGLKARCPKRAFSGSTKSRESFIGGRFINWYLHQLEVRPILTKSVTSAIIGGGGDLVCQKFVEGNKIDWFRNAKMSFIGLVMVGPTLHTWFGTLYRIAPSTDMRGVLVRLALDQTIFAACFTSAFFSAVLTLDGKADQIPATIKKEWWPTMKANWYLWIPANFINFSFVPLRLQVLFANNVALIWNVYLSMASHRD